MKKELGNEYNVKDLGEVETIIGWQITRDLFTQTLKIDQFSFIRNLVIEESLTNCNSNIIPMKAGSAIEMIEHDDYEDTEIKPYQHLIGKLMYLACGTRLDIAFIVSLLSRHNADPRKSHLRAAKSCSTLEKNDAVRLCIWKHVGREITNIASTLRFNRIR